MLTDCLQLLSIKSCQTITQKLSASKPSHSIKGGAAPSPLAYMYD